MEWRNSKGKFHRVNGPASKWVNDSERWYINDIDHNLNGPSAKFSVRHFKWYLNGRPHRIDGPACIRINEFDSWFINGSHYSETEYNRILKLP